VAFNFNQFDLAQRLSQGTRVALAAERYVDWLERDGPASDPDPTRLRNRIDKFLTDCDTEQIVQACMQPTQNLIKQLSVIEQYLERDIADFDRAKLRVLAAEIYMWLGDMSAAAQQARELRGIRAFEAWVVNLLGTANVRGEE
jgi:hypothetical protein